MKSNKQAKKLLHNYANDSITNEERNLVNNWYLKFNSGNTLSEEELQKEHDLGLIELNQRLNKRIKLTWIRVAAAAVLALFATSFFFYNGRNKGIKETITHAQDIPPGKHLAILTLSSGDVLQLDEKQKGVTINQRSIAYEDGTLVNSALQNEAYFNPVLVAQTPRGGTYNLTLSDGTLVILNAESSLKFPQVFNGTKRVVELTGEAYFEVSKNKKMPFIVKSANQSVEVLGTRFNVNAYPGSIPFTTLQEGSVKINAAGKEKLLSPGEQSNLIGKQLLVKKADVKSSLSWKDGYFRFSDESIPEIMLKISRWYNVTIQYDGEITKEVFTGEISRFSNISDVLDMLERTKIVHFKLEGRRVTVLN